MNGEKRAIRQRLREQRRGLAADQVAAAGAAVRTRLRTFPPQQEAGAVIAYIDAENEIPTAALIEDVVDSGRPVYLPTQSADGGVVRWRPGEPLVRGRGGVLEPCKAVPAVPARPALALVPVVAWDQAGGRLGRGGGFYDRLFATWGEGIVRVGLAYEFQQLDEVPRDAWDITLHYIITERRVVICGQAAAVWDAALQKGGLQL